MIERGHRDACGRRPRRQAIALTPRLQREPAPLVGDADAPAAGHLEPALERHQVHARGRPVEVGCDAWRRGSALRVRDTGRGIAPGVPAPRLRAFPPGRQQHDPAAWRSRARPRHRPPPRRAPWRHGSRRPARDSAWERRFRSISRLRARTRGLGIRARIRSRSCARRIRMRPRSRACASWSSRTRPIRASSCARHSSTRVPVTAVASSEQALAQLEAGASFDLIVSDIAMPGEDGFTLLRRLRALSAERGSPWRPVLALTAYAGAENEARFRSGGLRWPSRQAGPARRPHRRDRPPRPTTQELALRFHCSAVSHQKRSTSATLQAWATQPRGVYGASASKISLIEPMQASPRCVDEALRGDAGAASRSPGCTFSQASTNGPISQPQTVPWW